MAILFNGTTASAISAIDVSTSNTAEFTLAFTFKTGSTVSGVVQVPIHLNRASSFARAWGLEIGTTGLIRGFRYGGSFGYTASLGTAVANTVYRCVMTKSSAGVLSVYLNTIGNVQTNSVGNITDVLTRVITGALYDNAYTKYFGGQVARIAKYDSVLSPADITLLLTDGQTPASTSVAPSSYWIAVANDTPTIGVNSTVRTVATYDGDTLSSAPSYAITVVNSGNPVKAGSVFTATTTGFANVTSGTLGGKALTGVSFLSNTVTATAPVFVDGQTFYEVDTTKTLSLSDGTNSAQVDITAASPEGTASVVLNSPLLVSSTYLGYWMNSLGYTPVTGDRVIYSNSDCTVGEMGDVVADDPVVTTIWLWQNSADTLRSFTVTISEDGVIVDVTLSPSLSLGIGLGFGI